MCYMLKLLQSSPLIMKFRPHQWCNGMVDRGFETQSGQTKDYKIYICCFSTKHATLRRKSKDWLAGNQDNVSEWGDMSIRGFLFQWTSTIKIRSSTKWTSSSSHWKLTCSRHDIAEKLLSWQQSLTYNEIFRRHEIFSS